MHPRFERILHWLRSPLRLLRRSSRPPHDGMAPNGTDGAHPDGDIAARHAMSENDMTEHNELDANPQDDTGLSEDAAASVEGNQAESISDEDLEATLKSMQGELSDLTDMLASDTANEDPASAPEEPPVVSSDLMNDLTSEDEDDVEAQADVDPEGTLSDALKAMTSDGDDEDPFDEAAEAQEIEQVSAQVEALAESEPDAQFDESTQSVESVANPEPIAEGQPVIDQQPDNATASPPRATPPAAGFATARRRAFEETPMPAPQSRTPQPVQRSASGTASTAGVESAILQFATFLQGEVNGLWEDARTALNDIVTYRDRMAEATERIETLEREMLNMRDEIAFARRESRNLQAQMQNIRDDAARARQRADSSAMDAQSAADRAIAASREIETEANLHRDR